MGNIRNHHVRQGDEINGLVYHLNGAFFSFDSFFHEAASSGKKSIQ
ncbi:hypothetical protein [Neobacillus muris]|nr:hypothetical protein [Neobacillus muris]